MPDLCVVRVAQELISLQGKTNFFEKRVGEYAKAGVMSSEKGEHTREILAELGYKEGEIERMNDAGTIVTH